MVQNTSNQLFNQHLQPSPPNTSGVRVSQKFFPFSNQRVDSIPYISTFFFFSCLTFPNGAGAMNFQLVPTAPPQVLEEDFGVEAGGLFVFFWKKCSLPQTNSKSSEKMVLNGDSVFVCWEAWPVNSEVHTRC